MWREQPYNFSSTTNEGIGDLNFGIHEKEYMLITIELCSHDRVRSNFF